MEAGTNERTPLLSRTNSSHASDGAGGGHNGADYSSREAAAQPIDAVFSPKTPKTDAEDTRREVVTCDGLGHQRAEPVLLAAGLPDRKEPPITSSMAQPGGGGGQPIPAADTSEEATPSGGEATRDDARPPHALEFTAYSSPRIDALRLPGAPADVSLPFADDEPSDTSSPPAPSGERVDVDVGAGVGVGVSACRWYVLFVLCLVNCASVVNWQPLSAVPDRGMAYLGVELALYNVFNSAFLFLTLPLMPVGAYVCDRFGLRMALLVGSATLAVGGLLKVLVYADVWLASSGLHVRPSPYHNYRSSYSLSYSQNAAIQNDLTTSSADDQVPQHGVVLPTGRAQYAILVVAQLLCAASQPLVVCLSGKLSHDWFDSDWTGFATNLPNQMVPVGIMLGNLLGPFAATSPEQVPRLFLLPGLVSLVPLVFAVGVRRSRPERPPSEERSHDWSLSSEPPRPDENLLWRTWAALRLPCFWPLLLAFGIMIGVFDAITSLLYQLLCARGYTEQFSSVCISLLIGVGLVCSIWAMRLDQKVVAVPGLKLLFVGVTSSVALFALLSQLPDEQPLLVVALVACGVCMSCTYGFAIEWASALAERHALTPLVTVMLLVASTEFFGLLLTFASPLVLSLSPAASRTPSPRLVAASPNTSTLYSDAYDNSQENSRTAPPSSSSTLYEYMSTGSAADATYQCYDSLFYNLLMCALLLVATLLMLAFFRPHEPSTSTSASAATPHTSHRRSPTAC